MLTLLRRAEGIIPVVYFRGINNLLSLLEGPPGEVLSILENIYTFF